MKDPLKPLEDRSIYDPAWRRWRQGGAPKFRLKLWQRIHLALSRKILQAQARSLPAQRNHILTALSSLDRLQAKDEVGRGNPEKAQQLRQDAIEKANEAVRLAPSDTHSHLMLGHALISDGQDVAAMMEFKEVLRLDPNNPHGHSMRSLILAKQGKTGEAISEAQESLRISPDAGGYLRLGELLLKVGKREEAHFQWQKVCELDKSVLATAARMRLKETA